MNNGITIKEAAALNLLKESVSHTVNYLLCGGTGNYESKINPIFILPNQVTLSQMQGPKMYVKTVQIMFKVKTLPEWI